MYLCSIPLRSRCGPAGTLLFVAVMAGALYGQDELVLDHAVKPWLNVGAEIRSRSDVESVTAPGDEAWNSSVLSRVRVGIRASATEWLRFSVQLQDARTLSAPLGPVNGSHDNHGDAQYAFVDAGPSGDGRWSVRVGRQPLVFGDERLVGADASWDNMAQRFDGIRFAARTHGWQWDAFAASVTDVLPSRPDEFVGGNRIAGVYGSWAYGRTVVEPYMLWNHESFDNSSLYTPGVRIARRVGAHFDFTGEAALQRGTASELRVNAYSAYVEAGYRLERTDNGPRVSASYSYAGGDKNPDDGTVGTFNDLHPAAYNSCGFLEPFSWRNIRDLRFGGEWKGPREWQMRSEFHAYWLASLRDGVYVDEGPSVAYNPGAHSARLGSRLLFMAKHGVGRHSEVALGYAKFWAAQYMQTTRSLANNNAFVSWTARL